MDKNTQDQVVAAWNGLDAGQTVAVHCDREIITYMKSRFVGCELHEIIGMPDFYTMHRKKPDVRDLVYRLCSEVGFYFTPVNVDVRVTYLRTLVSEYNQANGSKIRVMNRNGRLYLVEDLNDRQSITREEYEALKARCDEMLRLGREMIKETDDEPLQPEPIDFEGSIIDVKPTTEIEPLKMPADPIPMTVATCFECRDDIPIPKGEMSIGRLCDTCRGVV